jgi:uncharacterized protein VirK/YbjX
MQGLLQVRGKLPKRIRQLTYLVLHPISHGRCMAAIARSGVNSSSLTSLKYLGDHLALSLNTSDRREALLQHHSMLADAVSREAADEIRRGALLWKRDVGGEAPLRLVLEPSRLAPMEGELQLRFSFKSDLQVLTFIVAPGDVFNLPHARVVFIGGLQGQVGRREEIREASKLNCEIAPAAMLLLAVQAIAKEIGAGALLAIGETDQISTGYSAPMVRFDYREFWTGLGGSRRGAFYSVPLETPSRPLSEVRLHRSRTRRKRAEKKRIQVSIETRVKELLEAKRSAQIEVAPLPTPALPEEVEA